MSLRFACLLFVSLLGGVAQAGTPAPFDLAGPTMDVVITRDENKLQIIHIACYYF